MHLEYNPRNQIEAKSFSFNFIDNTQSKQLLFSLTQYKSPLLYKQIKILLWRFTPSSLSHPCGFCGVEPPLSTKVNICVENRVVRLGKYIGCPCKFELQIYKILQHQSICVCFTWEISWLTRLKFTERKFLTFINLDLKNWV